MLNNILVELAKMIQSNSIISLFIVFVAGILTSLTPCSLSSIPLIMGYVKGSGEDDLKKSFALSVIFVFGMSLTFISIGIISSLIGRLVGVLPPYVYIILGLFLILMAIQSWGLYYFLKPLNLGNKSKSKSYMGAFISGILAGFFASPCATPVMFALITMVISKASLNLLWSILLFIMFAIGHSLVTLIAGTWSASLNKFLRDEKYHKMARIVEIVLGTMIFILGVYFISLGL